MPRSTTSDSEWETDTDKSEDVNVAGDDIIAIPASSSNRINRISIRRTTAPRYFRTTSSRTDIADPTFQPSSSTNNYLTTSDSEWTTDTDQSIDFDVAGDDVTTNLTSSSNIINIDRPSSSGNDLTTSSLNGFNFQFPSSTANYLPSSSRNDLTVQPSSFTFDEEEDEQPLPTNSEDIELHPLPRTYTRDRRSTLSSQHGMLSNGNDVYPGSFSYPRRTSSRFPPQTESSQACGWSTEWTRTSQYQTDVQHIKRLSTSAQYYSSGTHIHLIRSQRDARLLAHASSIPLPPSPIRSSRSLDWDDLEELERELGQLRARPFETMTAEEKARERRERRRMQRQLTIIRGNMMRRTERELVDLEGRADEQFEEEDRVSLENMQPQVPWPVFPTTRDPWFRTKIITSTILTLAFGSGLIIASIFIAHDPHNTYLGENLVTVCICAFGLIGVLRQGWKWFI